MGDCQSKYSEPTVPPTTPALDRASIPAMSNVVGDELRKLNEKLDGLDLRVAAKVYVELGVKVLQERLREDGLIASQRYGALLDHAEAQATAIERLAAQLTALRAEVACKCEVIAKFRGGGCAKDPRKCPIHGYTEVPVARKKKQGRKRTARKSR